MRSCTTISDPAQDDLREQLFNRGECGPKTQVQLPADQITSIRGVLFDVDPELFKVGPFIPELPSSPAAFNNVVLKPWLERHPVLKQAEVRGTGRGLHAILWLNPTIELHSNLDQQVWAKRIRALKYALPCDPRAPGITATTRVIGSINSKTGEIVEQLCAGSPCTEQQLIDLCSSLKSAPFSHFLNLLSGRDRCAPCPICREADSELVAGDYFGRCYKKCGEVGLDQLLQEVMTNA